jgi:hypothetical protein
MNDFNEIEDRLKKLRPASPSQELAQRIESALSESTTASTAGVVVHSGRIRFDWWSIGLGLAAAALLLIFARLNLEQPNKARGRVASAPIATISPARNGASAFVPEGLTRVVYNTRDEGLHFQSGSEEPVRRLRSSARETLQWRNPNTGASLRVSYPSEEVSLIPISGQ